MSGCLHSVQVAVNQWPLPIGKLKRWFKVIHSNDHSLGYVYGHSDARDAEIAKGLILDEARRIASNIAKLPSLLLRRAERAAD
jgi:hypothetical protein